MPPKILILSEYPNPDDLRLKSPYASASGQVLRGMLTAAGIDPEADVRITYVFSTPPYNGKVEAFAGPKAEALKGYPQAGDKLWIREVHRPELERLRGEIQALQPNVIVPLGSISLWALTKERGIKKNRGTPIMDYTGNFKVIPTYHPSAINRSWKLRPIAIADFAKIKRESAFPEIRRPKRTIWLEPTLEDLEEFWAKYLAPAPAISCDIETKQQTITEVGFAPNPYISLVIPFYSRRQPNKSYWPTAEDEFKAWRFVEMVCNTKPLFGQHFNYDLFYFHYFMGIEVRTLADDTMILHHAMQPEMEKSLGFLGSIYTNEPSWKFMRQDAETLKKED